MPAETAAAEDSIATTLLASCPVCGYRLRGLPETYRCPECAFRFDRQTRVWRVLHFRTYGGLSTVVCLILACAWLGTWWFGLVSRPPTPYQDAIRQTLRLLMVVVSVALIIWKVNAFRSNLFVSITPDGLVYRLNGRQHACIPWANIESVRVVPSGRRHRIIVRPRGNHPVDLSPALQNESEMEQLMLALCAYRPDLVR